MPRNTPVPCLFLGSHEETKAASRAKQEGGTSYRRRCFVPKEVLPTYFVGARSRCFARPYFCTKYEVGGGKNRHVNAYFLRRRANLRSYKKR
jgi:hypothetical protein